MKLVVINKTKLVPLEDNPRKMLDKEGHSKLVAMIKEHGFQSPLQVWRETPAMEYIILCGNHRFAAGLEVGLETFPCIIYEGSRAKALSRAISDNKSSEYTGWDNEKLKAMMEELTLSDGLSVDDLTGFSIDEIDELISDATGDSNAPSKEDTAPAVDDGVDPITRPGDMWSLGPHRLICADATDKKNVEQLMAGTKADMVFTDPPYGMKLKLDTELMTGIFKNQRKQRPGSIMVDIKNATQYDPIVGDDKDYDPSHIFRDFGYCKEMFLWGADYYAERIPNKNKGSWLIWDKRAGIEHVNFSLSEFETCWSKKKHARIILRYRWFGMMGLEQGDEDLKRRVHPNQKPIKMFLWMINKYSQPGDKVVDPFLGSGSTLITCDKLGRVCYGAEIFPKYCDVILRRYVDFASVDPVRQDGVKWSSLCQEQNG